MVYASNDSKRIPWIDNTRVFACFLVILCHCTENIYLDSVARAGVPLFFMLSGALLLPLKKGIVPFYLSRLRRIVLPFALWSLIYLTVVKWKKLSVWAAADNWDALAGEPLRIFESPSYMHLWYIYVLIGIYLFAPFLSGFIQTKRHMQVFLCIWAVTLFTGFYREYSGIEYFQGQAAWNPEIDMLYYFSGYLGYFILGYYLKNFVVGLRGKGTLLFLWIVYGIGLAVTVAGTIHYRKIDVELFYSYLSFHVMAASLALFCLIPRIKLKTGWLIRAIKDVSDMSFGIYLVHALFVLYFVKKKWLSFHTGSTPLNDLLMAALVMALSYAVVKLFSRIPYLRILGGFCRTGK